LFLAMLATLVQEEHGDDKANQEQGQGDPHEDYYDDFLVLSRHRKAIVKEVYKRISKTLVIALRLFSMNKGILVRVRVLAIP
jgi:hypothetical protein